MVVVALGAAALVVVPPSAGVGLDPAVTVPAAAPAAAGAPEPAAEAAEQSNRVPAVQSVRFNPVAFRDTVPARSAVAPVRTAAPATAVPAQPRITTTAKPGTAAAVAIDFALAQRGLPYVWGGNGPQQGHRGFDCSGLTTYAYKRAGIDLPRTAHTQFYAGPHVPAGAELEPGDLVFYGVPERVGHVGLYIGDGRMVSAPTFGKPVRLAYVRYPGDKYLGATRPAAGRDADEGLLSTPELPVVVPPLPEPEQEPVSEQEFAHPEVPAEEIVAAEPPVQEPPADALALAEGAPGDGSEDPAGAEPLAARPEGEADEPATSVPADAATALGEEPAEPVESSTPESTASESPAAESAAAESPAAESAAAESAAPESAAPESAAPESSAPESPAPEAPAPDAAAVAESAGPEAGSEAPVAETTVPAEPVAEVGPPVGLAVAGSELAVARAESDENGLPSAPESADRAALRWSPADEDRAARAVVALHADASVPEVGTVVTLRAEDGTTTEVTVRSRDVVDAEDAAELASGRGESTRLVLLVTDPDTDEIVVLIAE